jgi:hypothetical protein
LSVSILFRAIYHFEGININVNRQELTYFIGIPGRVAQPRDSGKMIIHSNILS